jgi:Spy/CpxP family protein refolding chaperone
MKFKLTALAVALVSVAACDRSVTSPRDQDVALLAFDQAATMDSATMVPRGPFMDNAPPDSVKLTDAQKAAIKALHDAFAAAHATQFAQLKAIHDEAIAAHKAGKTRAEIRAIMEKAKPIMESMRPDFEALRTKIEAILTPAQKAWAAAHQRGGGGPMGGPGMGGMPGRP